MRAGCMCENVVFVFFYRQDAAKRQTAGIKFTHRPKKQVFRPAWATRYTDSCQTWRGRRTPVSALLCKISPQSAQEVGMRSEKSKFPLFGKESPCKDKPFDRIPKFLGSFIRPFIQHE